MKLILLCVLTLLLIGCGRRSPVGIYQSVGAEDKFRLTLEVKKGGQAQFATRSNLGNAEMDRTIQATMSLENAKWTQDAKAVIVTGVQAGGKTMIYRFLPQPNGDLIWDQNGARLAKAK